MTLITVISSLTLLVVLCSVRTVNSGSIVLLSDDEDGASPTSEPTFATSDFDYNAWFVNDQVEFIPISCCLQYTELTTEQKTITDAFFLAAANEIKDFSGFFCQSEILCQCKSSDMECFKEFLFSSSHFFSDGCPEALGGGFDDLCSSTFPNFEKPYILQEWSALGDDITTSLELAGYEQSSWTPGEVSLVAPNACTAASNIDEVWDEQSLATKFILEFARVAYITDSDFTDACYSYYCNCSLSDDECLSDLFYEAVLDNIDYECNGDEESEDDDDEESEDDDEESEDDDAYF